jgi:hypothetical protein
MAAPSSRRSCTVGHLVTSGWLTGGAYFTQLVGPPASFSSRRGGVIVEPRRQDQVALRQRHVGCGLAGVRS